ncbi:fibronectin type III [Vibrio phage vB_VhaP_PG11]|nr:fibronectin type III [Vibrio phage vB_VhaP_PG11]
MTVRLVGVLRTPLGDPVPNQDIRITATNTDGSVLGATTVYTTDAGGIYDFNLAFGNYLLEVLFQGQYKLAGSLLMNEATPQDITLEEALNFSNPVEPEDILHLPVAWQNWWQELVDGVWTRCRELRHQIVDDNVHSVDLQETYVSEDSTKRGAKRSTDIKSCAAHIGNQENVYSNSDADQYAATGSVVETNLAAKAETVQVGDGVNISSEAHTATVQRQMDESVTTEYSKTTSVTTPSGTMSFLKSTLGNVFSKISDIFSGSNRIYESQIVDDLLSEDVRLLEVNGKSTVRTHDTTGSRSKYELIVDDVFIGSTTLSPTFRINTETGLVRVNGQLQVDQLLDENGDPIEPPEDGDTIFQVSQFSDSNLGPWEDTMESYHYWRRDALSVNGVIGSYGAPYQFRGTDGDKGDDGSVITVEYQYSPDGITDWSPTLRTGDKYRRERTVTDGVGGDWSAPGRITGDDGSSIEVRSEYSVDGIFNWHTILAPEDKFERRATFINGVQDTPWSDPFPIGKGDTGIDGQPGSGWYSIENGTGNWPGDSQATADFISNFGRAPTLNDHLTYVDTLSNATNSYVKRCNSPIGDPVTWSTPSSIVNGDMVVNETLSARHIVADSITGNKISSATTIIAGSGSWTAGMNGDDTAGAGVYQNWRFWSGATDPALANFRVDRNGLLAASGVSLNGTMEAGSGNNIAGIGAYPNNIRIFAGNANPTSAPFKVFQDGSIDVQDGTFRGTIYAEEIVGDLVSARAYTGNTSTADGWITYGTLTVTNNTGTTATVVITGGTVILRTVSAQDGWIEGSSEVGWRLLKNGGLVGGTQVTSAYAYENAIGNGQAQATNSNIMNCPQYVQTLDDGETATFQTQRYFTHRFGRGGGSATRTLVGAPIGQLFRDGGAWT